MTTTVASLQAIFTANTSDFDAGVGRVRAGLSGVGEAVGGTLQRVGGGMQSAGAKIALGIAPLVAFGAQGIKTATQFDSAMAEISARTGLVGEDLAAIEQYALDMGAATVFSATESAEAFLQLLTSGQSVEEAIATLPLVLDAAAASGADLGQTADLLTDIMAAYGLEIDNLTPDVRAAAEAMGLTVEQMEAIAREGDPGNHTLNALAEATGRTNSELLKMMQMEGAVDVTNALAQAAGASSADINSLGQGFANVGPIAAAYGLSVEQTAAVLALLSENGIKGAEAGTALKSMLLNMTRPTAEVAAAWEELGVSFYDAEGNARDIGLVIGELDAALDGLPIEEQNRLMYELAGSYGIVALQALRGEISIEEMMEMMNEQATAAEVAEARMDTFAGAMDELGGAVETLMIKAFRPFMNNTLKPLAREVAGMVNRVADWAAAHPRLITAVGLLVGGLAALSTVLIAGGGIVSFFGVALGALLSPIGLVVAAVAGLVAAFKTNFLGFGDFVRDLGSGLKTLASDIKSAFEQEGLQGVLQVVWDKIKTGVIDAAGWVKDSIVTPVANAVNNINWDDVPGQIDKILDKFAAVVVDVATWVDTNIITPVVDELSKVDWAGVGSKLLDLLEKLLGVTAAGLTDIGAWVLENIINPIIDDLSAVDWTGVGNDLLDLLEQFLGLAAAGLAEIGTWVWDNILSPIVDYLGTVDWSGVASRLGDMLNQFLGLAAAGISSMGKWVWDNILSPIVSYLSNVNWSNTISRLGDLLEQFLGLAAAGISSLGTWVWENILSPIVSYLTNVNWSNTISRLEDLLEKFLGLAAAGISSLGTWVWENIISPIVDYLGTVDWGDVGNKLLDLLEKLLGYVGAGIESIGTWVWENIISPIVSKLSDPETWTAIWNAAKDLGGQLFNGLIDALASLPGKIYELILGAIPSDIHLGFLGSIHIGGAGAPIGPGAPDEGDQSSGGSAGGGPVVGGVPRVVGETGPELFVPPVSGRILTSNQLAALGGGGQQVVISGGTFILQGVQNTQQLFDELKKIAARRA